MDNNSGGLLKLKKDYLSAIGWHLLLSVGSINMYSFDKVDLYKQCQVIEICANSNSFCSCPQWTFKCYKLPAYSSTEECFGACWISAGILLTIMMCLQEQNLPFLPHLFPLCRSCHHWTDNLINTSITQFMSKVQTMHKKSTVHFLSLTFF